MKWRLPLRAIAPIALAMIAAGAFVFFLIADRRDNATPPALAGSSTLAVLPFVNAGEDAGDEYFSASTGTVAPKQACARRRSTSKRR